MLSEDNDIVFIILIDINFNNAYNMHFLSI